MKILRGLISDWLIAIGSFGRTFDLDVRTMPCHLAVLEDTCDWAKSVMKAPALDRQLSETHCVVCIWSPLNTAPAVRGIF